MKEELRNICISSFVDSVSPGWGFIVDFVSSLLSFNREETGLSNIVMLWDYPVTSGQIKKVTYFSSTKLNMIGLHREHVLLSKKVLYSADEDKNTYVDKAFMWYDNYVIIPVNAYGYDHGFIDAKCAIVLLSNDEIKISKSDCELFHLLLNAKKPVIDGAPYVEDCLSCFQFESEDFSRIGRRMSKMIESLRCLSNINTFLGKHGVIYATFWKLNILNDLSTENLYKQYDCNYDDRASVMTSHSVITHSMNHYLNEVRFNKPKSINDSWVTPLFTYEEVIDSIDDKQYLESVGLDTNSMSTILIPVTIEGEIVSLDICCLYIKDILFTPFVSFSFANQIQHLFQTSLERTNRDTQSVMITELMKKFYSVKDQRRFYTHVNEILKQYNSVEDCIVYIKADGNTLYVPSIEDINDPSTFTPKVYTMNNRFSFHIASRYENDDEFVNLLENMQILEEGEPNNVNFYRCDTPSSIVKNALCIAIENIEKTEKLGLIVLINKTHNQSPIGIKDFDIITMDNVFATYLSSMYLYQFGLWNSAISRKNYLLKKLRHEIPQCTHVISEKVSAIKKEVKDREYIMPKLLNAATHVDLNRSRIEMLASFFASVDYDDKRFVEGSHLVDIIEMIDSNMDLFREESRKKGVAIVVNKHVDSLVLMVSDFYPLSIINIINNAIRYCSRGTNVIIDLYEDHLDVVDIGIPIPKGEEDLIYKDGYRGSNAQEIDSAGIGFGLNISKRVLEAHGSSIFEDSQYIGDRNYYLEYTIYKYLKSIKPSECNEFITKSTEPSETSLVNSMFKELQESAEKMPQEVVRFCNTNILQIRDWLAEDENDGGPYFIEMEDAWFSNEIANVKFTIEFGNKVLAYKKYE